VNQLQTPLPPERAERLLAEALRHGEMRDRERTKGDDQHVGRNPRRQRRAASVGTLPSKKML
jgi:hypothetical protein